MVDVGHKPVTNRSAEAEGHVVVGHEIAKQIKLNTVKKGDVITVAQLAGVCGAKMTPQLIPLCHQINLNHINVTIKNDEANGRLIVKCVVSCDSKTGVEMEALTGCAVACLTIYDMCKSISKSIVIADIKLLRKSGGKSGVYELNQK